MVFSFCAAALVPIAMAFLPLAKAFVPEAIAFSPFNLAISSSFSFSSSAFRASSFFSLSFSSSSFSACFSASSFSFSSFNLAAFFSSSVNGKLSICLVRYLISCCFFSTAFWALSTASLAFFAAFAIPRIISL